MVFSELGDVLMVDDLGNPIRTIHFNRVTPIRVAWSPDGCELQVTVTDGESIRLLKINMDGNVLQELFVGGYNSAGNLQTWPSLSPDGCWVAYVVWSGAGYRAGAEKQDVEVVAVENQEVPIRITAHGGASATGAEWAPQGNHLAFSDFDEAGIGQLYSAAPDGSDRRQLSSFATVGLKIGEIAWSPSGDALAFTTYYGDEQGELWVVSTNGSEPTKLALPSTSPMYADWLWWSRDASMLIAGTRGSVLDNGLYWFNVYSGAVEHVFKESDAPNGSISFLFPIVDAESAMGFMAGDRNLYEISLATRALVPWAHGSDSTYGLLQEISPVLNGSVDTESCQQN